MDAYNKKNLVKIMSHLALSKCATLACLKLKIPKKHSTLPTNGFL